MLKKTTTTKTKSKSKVNEAGNYTKPSMRKRLFEKIMAGSRGGKPEKKAIDIADVDYEDISD